MAKTTSEILEIVSAGGGVIISHIKPTPELMQIAAAAKKSGAKIIIKYQKKTSEMKQIAHARGGNIIFELDA